MDGANVSFWLMVGDKLVFLVIVFFWGEGKLSSGIATDFE